MDDDQVELELTLGEFEAPFGRLAGPPTWRLERAQQLPPGFLESLGNLHGSYTLGDRTVYVFDAGTLEVRREGGLYSD